MLQGLTVASLDSCASSFYSYASIKPQVSWINTVILDCGSVENIQNGKMSLDKKSKTSVGATATIVCEPGYLASRQKIVCLKTGKWQKSICTIKDCGPIKKIVSGRVILDKTKTSTYGATATVKCSPGYRANQEKIVCLDTGKWETARCKIKDCGTPKNVTNGNLHFIGTKFGSTASLVCDKGYDGNGTISCLDTGSWETPPRCSIKDCGTPLNVTNGNLNYIGTTFGSTASLACDRGYDGNGTISCLDTGSWETPPNCSIKECPEGWTTFEKSCYLLEAKHEKTWENAKNDCESKQGHLVEITSPSENKFIGDWIGFYYVWMGLNDIKSEGIFLWEYSGATVDLSEVGTSIGYNDNDLDCIYIDASAGAWFADSCERTLKYMCELSL
ncbi:sushi, von Willebrand factor type A, EGF and pentraxin domain-containing protein 1-like [Ruditapes philippinarum]|uniref:sushi, von Willebrand factor type A, EGF and pentraxin domain-containing protein 1-like n=1 Tax=Ruditapes philippinarum TaxID=129788 RepID=UPI00295AF650|nr:sushi, von Willebrand factor type A, EGF and pentraxin domain-containing protein 1-like [Ruditapes philippinarum]